MTDGGTGSEWWEYTVSTKFGELKAVAIAIEAHVVLFERNNQPYHVAVTDEGVNQDINVLGDPRED